MIFSNDFCAIGSFINCIPVKSNNTCSVSRDCLLPVLIANRTMRAGVPGTVHYLNRLPVKSNNACRNGTGYLLPVLLLNGPVKSLVLSITRRPTSQNQTVHAAVWCCIWCCLLPGRADIKSNNSGCRAALSIKLQRQLACQIKECLQRSRVLPITWTACLSGEMMAREAEGALVHVVLLLWLTVAMVTAADVEGGDSGHSPISLCLLLSCALSDRPSPR